MALFDSGPVFVGGPDEVVTYVAAGTYDVVCMLHSAMDATVYVPVGFVYDVQRRRPDGTWRLGRGDTAERSATVTVQGEGTWRCRGRLERVWTGATSAWSRVATATVV